MFTSTSTESVYLKTIATDLFFSSLISVATHYQTRIYRRISVDLPVIISPKTQHTIIQQIDRQLRSNKALDSFTFTKFNMSLTPTKTVTSLIDIFSILQKFRILQKKSSLIQSSSEKIFKKKNSSINAITQKAILMITRFRKYNNAVVYKFVFLFDLTNKFVKDFNNAKFTVIKNFDYYKKMFIIFENALVFIFDTLKNTTLKSRNHATDIITLIKKNLSRQNKSLVNDFVQRKKAVYRKIDDEFYKSLSTNINWDKSLTTKLERLKKIAIAGQNMNSALNISESKMTPSIHTLFVDDLIVRDVTPSARDVVIRNVNNINKTLKVSKLFKRKTINSNLRVELSSIPNQITPTKKQKTNIIETNIYNYDVLFIDENSRNTFEITRTKIAKRKAKIKIT